jgi:hypothetical protein
MLSIIWKYKIIMIYIISIILLSINTYLEKKDIYSEEIFYITIVISIISNIISTFLIPTLIDKNINLNEKNNNLKIKLKSNVQELKKNNSNLIIENIRLKTNSNLSYYELNNFDNIHQYIIIYLFIDFIKNNLNIYNEDIFNENIIFKVLNNNNIKKIIDKFVIKNYKENKENKNLEKIIYNFIKNKIITYDPKINNFSLSDAYYVDSFSSIDDIPQIFITPVASDENAPYNIV